MLAKCEAQFVNAGKKTLIQIQIENVNLRQSTCEISNLYLTSEINRTVVSCTLRM